jgi:hypothetical protein
MLKKLLFILSFLLTISFVNSIVVSSCQNISSSGYYELNQNINSVGTCMNINVSNIDLNCNSFSINHSNSVSGTGIYVENNLFNITIQNCNIFDGGSSTRGIRFYNTSNSFILNNSITLVSGSRDVVLLQSSNNNLISGNFINSTVAWYDPLFITSNSNNNIVRNNSIYHYRIGGGGTSIHIDNSDFNLIENNRAYVFNGASSIALRIDGGGNNNTIRNNYGYSDIGYAINLDSGGADYNLIYGNIFNSTIQPNSNSGAINFWNNSIIGNFYANPTSTAFSQNASCIDGDSNGICDSAYTIPGAGAGIDYMPLSQLPAWHTSSSTPGPSTPSLSVASLPSSSFLVMIISLGLILFILI